MTDLPAARDTNIGGARRDFPSTCWSRLGAARPGPDADDAVAELARHYWKPIYAYIRTRWSKGNEEAKDLTQAFFAWMIESGFLAKADPGRGRFRGFVKKSLEHFLQHDARDGGRLKRGGGRAIVAIEGGPDDAAVDLADGRQRSPEEALDEAWRNGLLIRAEALLEETLRREKRETTFAIFRAYCLSDEAGLNYRDLAARHGITEGDVLSELRHARRRYRAVLTDLVAETVKSPEDLDEELRALFGPDPE